MHFRRHEDDKLTISVGYYHYYGIVYSLLKRINNFYRFPLKNNIVKNIHFNKIKNKKPVVVYNKTLNFLFLDHFLQSNQ